MSSNGPCSLDQPGVILEFKRCLDRFVLDLGVFWSDQTQKALEDFFEQPPFKMLCSNSSLYLTPPENERLKIHLKIVLVHIRKPKFPPIVWRYPAFFVPKIDPKYPEKPVKLSLFSRNSQNTPAGHIWSGSQLILMEDLLVGG